MAEPIPDVKRDPHPATGATDRARWLWTRLSQLGAVGACLIGVMVLAGWATGIVALTSISERFIVMLPNTAAGVLAAGGAILLLHPPHTDRRVVVARALATFVLVLGVLSLLSRVLGVELAHIGMLFRERVATHPYRPVGLMATNSALVLAFTGAAMLLTSTHHRSFRRLARVLTAMSGSIVAIALLGHLYGARALYAVDRAAGMAPIAALALAAVQVGVLLLRPTEGVVSLVTGADLAGRLMRRMLPATLIFPILIGLIWIRGHDQNVFSREAGVAVFMVLTAGWITIILLVNARFIREADRQRAELLEREQEARAAAEAGSKAKSDFLAVMSHELRTPLNAVVGYVDLLVDEIAGPVTPQQTHYLTRIRDTARYLTRTVGEILTLVRTNARDDIPHIAPVDLAALIDDVEGILTPLADAKGLEFSSAYAGPARVLTDAHRLKQILINLGGNAVKFTPKGSVRVDARAAADAIEVDVIDTGIGIAPDHQQRIFEEFWQVEEALTRIHDGIGLGLAVSRRLARQLGGEIEVVSTLGSGSTFRVTVPAARQPSPRAQAGRSATGRDSGRGV